MQIPQAQMYIESQKLNVKSNKPSLQNNTLLTYKVVHLTWTKSPVLKAVQAALILEPAILLYLMKCDIDLSHLENSIIYHVNYYLIQTEIKLYSWASHMQHMICLYESYNTIYVRHIMSNHSCINDISCQQDDVVSSMRRLYSIVYSVWFDLNNL